VICPQRSAGAAIVMPEVNVEAMNQHLAEISRWRPGTYVMPSRRCR